MRSKVTCVCCLMSVLDSIHGFLDRVIGARAIRSHRLGSRWDAGPGVHTLIPTSWRRFVTDPSVA
jgi:hypothetical protein